MKLSKIIFLLTIFTFLVTINNRAICITSSYTGYYFSDQEDPQSLNDTYKSYIGPDQETIKDPFEKINRVMFEINMTIDTIIIQPISTLYSTIIPNPAKIHINSVIKNLGTPITFMNDALQGNFEKANISFWRFVINTFLGVGGLMDVASEVGLEYHNEDFGQTLANYGAPSGVYLVLPLVGPASTRDAIGRVVDYFTDPFRAEFGNKIKQNLSYLRFIHKRAEKDVIINHIKNESLDPYIAMKSLYIQNRLNLIKK